MVKYSVKPDKEEKAAKASISYLRVHFKHCVNIAEAIKGQKLGKAQEYLQNVKKYTEAIPIRKYTGGIGRHAVAKQYGVPGDKCGWPQKATQSFLDLLKNVESNAESKGLNIEDVTITHANVNQAPKMRRRTYRAHGRINAYMSSPAHIAIICEEKSDEVAKEKEEKSQNLSKKRMAQLRSIKAGGGN